MAGTDYELVDPAPPITDGDAPIAVAEAFSYACSHCAHFEPQLAAWVAKLPTDVAFEAVPMPLSDVWTEFARAHYAAADLGLSARTHAALFEAIHTQGARIDSVDALVQWFADNSAVDAATFRAAMTSPGTDARIAGARARAQRWGVESTPTLVIDDRYRVPGFSNAEGGFARTLVVADLLLAEARRTRTPSA
ncbi:MAG: thiol:disulfide interchange protein DsbA/DsbL [Lysobacterales bacterium]